ncbi:MAG: hypothetical protein FWF02_03650 [Micrococcales bacterium]|nr:hypothetical protein [Micrococcales bacterium]MCL2666784.1 hypothetical protein [Micrococcales bacterium]
MLDDRPVKLELDPVFEQHVHLALLSAGPLYGVGTTQHLSIDPHEGDPLVDDLVTNPGCLDLSVIR